MHVCSEHLTSVWALRSVDHHVVDPACRHLSTGARLCTLEELENDNARGPWLARAPVVCKPVAERVSRNTATPAPLPAPMAQPGRSTGAVRTSGRHRLRRRCRADLVVDLVLVRGHGRGGAHDHFGCLRVEGTAFAAGPACIQICLRRYH